MKVLYAFQSTGNGHTARAREIIPILREMAEVDVMTSGRNSTLSLPEPPDMCLKGLTMAYNEDGAISLMKTFRGLAFRGFLREVLDLPVRNYDLVISDFEPVSAYASLLKGVPSVALSHQAAFLSKHTPRAKAGGVLGPFILKYFAPCRFKMGFHFMAYDDFIFGPVIRREVLLMTPQQDGKVLVYLPAYSTEKLVQLFGQLPDNQFLIFGNAHYGNFDTKNCKIFPAGHLSFDSALNACSAVLCGAGFELPAEAMYLGKKLAVIPIKGQFEQKCNAAALAVEGISVFDSLPSSSSLRAWMERPKAHFCPVPSDPRAAIHRVLEDLAQMPSKWPVPSFGASFH